MPRIESYDKDRLISGREFVIGTDADKGNKTANYLIDDIRDYITGGLSGSDNDSVYDGDLFENGTYTWMKYATSTTPAPSGMVDIPTAETIYVGFAFNKDTRIESSDHLDYNWYLIDGDTSLNTYINEYGQTKFFWVKYAESIIPPYGIVDTAVGMKFRGMGLNKDVAEPIPSTFTDQEWFEQLEWHQVIVGNPIPGTNTYNWFAYATDINGANISGFIDDKTHIGIGYAKTDPISQSDPAEYVWGLFTGPHAEVDAAGLATGLFTHIKFVKTPYGTLSDAPNGSNYIGFSYGNALATPESTTYIDYIWRDIQYKGWGIAKESTFTWLKYSAFDNGYNGTTISIQDTAAGMSFIGLAINKINPESTDPLSDVPESYFWTAILGDNSYIGPDGNTYYIWTKYATDTIGTNFSNDPNSPVTATHIGFSYANLLKESEDPASEDHTNYEWALINSDIQNNEWLYYWVKFSNSDLNSDLCPSPTAVLDFSDSAVGSTFMGIAYDKKTSIEGLNPCDYVWNPLTGDQGYIGADGKTYYTWVKYTASLEDSSELTRNRVDDSNWMGLSSGHLTPDDLDDDTTVGGSENWRTYTWVTLESEDNGSGRDGANGIDGEDGQDALPGDDGKDAEDCCPLLVTVVCTPEGVDNVEDLVSHFNNDEALVKSGNELVIFEECDDEVTPEYLDQNIPLILSFGSKTTNSITVNWTDGDPVTQQYLLHYKFNEGIETTVSIVDRTLRTYTIPSLALGHYEIWIEALGSEIGDIKAGTPNIIVDLFAALQANLRLTNEIGSVTDTTVDLTWGVDAGFTAEYFKIFDGGTGGTLIYETPHGLPVELTKIITGLTPEQAYSLTAVAYTIADVPSVESTPAVVITTTETVPTVLPPPVISIKAENTNSIELTIALSINPATPSFTNFFVYHRKAGATTWVNPRLVVSSTDTTPLVAGLLQDTDYEFRVQLHDSVTPLTSADSNIVSGSTLEEVFLADVSLRKEDKLTSTKLGLGFVGQLTVSSGTPDTWVTLSVDIWTRYFQGNVVFGSLEFENAIKIVPSGFTTKTIYAVPDGSLDTLRIEVLLDVNGEYDNIFKLSADEPLVEIVVNTAIRVSTGGTGQASAQRAYTGF